LRYALDRREGCLAVRPLARGRAVDAEPVRDRRGFYPAADASLARMFDTCTLAVLSLMNRVCPISGLDRPAERF
jgi:hypothetical protein